MQGTRLQAISETDDPVPSVAPAQRAQDALLSLLITNLKVMSQRMVIALASLVDLMMIGSVFALWLLIIKTPSTAQLIGVAGYATFILVAIFMRRR